MMIQLIEKYYRLLIRTSSSLESPFLLAARLYWGWQFMQAGWGKLHDIGKVIGFFTELGIPAPVLNAYFVSALEFGGGLLLLLGLGSRLIALPLVIDMAHLRRGLVLARRSGGGPKEREAHAADGLGSLPIGCGRLKRISEDP